MIEQRYRPAKKSSNGWWERGAVPVSNGEDSYYLWVVLQYRQVPDHVHGAAPEWSDWRDVPIAEEAK